ncbi:HEPN domain-containing protein [Candidatus Pacearchaeota archaeon]|nr:HEPN domain-containing protein [Candidatus Pacearchaeota archaeon]
MRKIKEYFANKKLLDQEIKFYENKGNLTKSKYSLGLVNAHLEKSKHNLGLVDLLIKNKNYNDWVIVGLYYALYHSCLALLANKGYTSKNHLATLLFLIKNYSNFSYEEIEMLEELSINKSDAEFYTDLKQERHQASYSTNSLFNEGKTIEVRKKTISFINKVEAILEE